MPDPSDPDAGERLLHAAGKLQYDLAMRDKLASMFTARPSSRAFMPELLVLELSDLKLRMDGNLNHYRAHLHVDYRKQRHVATYAIDTGKRLIGDRTPYDDDISAWIGKHRADLQKVWDDMRGSGYSELTVAQLHASGL